MVKNDSVIPFITHSDLDNEKIFTICQTHNGDLWLGTGGKGVFYFRDNKVHHFTKDDGLCNNTVRVIVQDFENVIWIGTDRGVNIFIDDSLKRFKKYASQTYTDAIIDDDGSVWFSTYNGWLVQYKSLNIQQKDTLVSSNFFRFKNKRIWSFIRDAEKTFWIGTTIDLTKFPQTPFLSFNSSDKLHDDNVTAIGQVDNNKIFVGANASKHSLTEFTFSDFNHLTTLENVTVLDGLVGNRV